MRQILAVATSLVVASLLMTQQAHATRSFITGAQVIEIRSYGAGQFGGCVAQINKNVNSDGDQVLTCGNQFLVGFGCDGTKSSSKSEAQNMLATAQLAMVTGSNVDVYVNDQERYGTLCVAEFVYVKQ